MPDFVLYTLEQLQTLTDAIATGAKSVKYGDKEVVYKTSQEMEATQKKMMIYLGLMQEPSGTILIEHDRGFYK